MKLLKVSSIDSMQEYCIQYLKQNIKTEIIDINDLNNRVLSKDIYAAENIPQFRKSNVDGYAIKAYISNGATENNAIPLKLVGRVKIGENTNINMQDEECIYVPTGAIIPNDADSMIMIEDTSMVENSNIVLIKKAVSINNNISQIGQDISLNEQIFKVNHQINERDIAILASLGINKVEVYKQFNVSIISSGNELVEITESVTDSKIRDVNTILLKTLLEKNNFIINKTLLIKDNLHDLEKALNNNSDIIITSAGSSKGEHDYTLNAIENVSKNILINGISLKPGKPSILAQTKKQLFIGLPGNPVSAYIVLLLTLIQAKKSLLCNNNKSRIKAKLSSNYASDPGKTNILLVELEKYNDEIIAKPLFYRSSQVKILAKADGYVIIPIAKEGLKLLEEVEVNLFWEIHI
ncbi:molybdopterin molybdotransferase MoeA [Mycoplasma sp. P36-A1]|uniref:molybdopterin molybdotransferase MoeA n=1 Tax=Mycoplasma sp. P36-A1 TaxID=3252900 RepID=UPI003C2E52C6